MKNTQKGNIGIIITIVIALLLGAGGYMLGIQKNNTDKIANDKIIADLNDSAKNSPKLEDKAVSETANWKTYKNNRLGYQISYPPSYHVAFEDDLFNFDETKYEKGNPNGVKIQIQKESGTQFSGLDLRNKDTQAWIIGKMNVNIKTNGEDNETPIQSKVIGQISYTNTVVRGPGGLFDIYYSFAGTDSLYKILVWGNSNDPENINKILSTFKFTK